MTLNNKMYYLMVHEMVGAQPSIENCPVDHDTLPPLFGYGGGWSFTWYYECATCGWSKMEEEMSDDTD